jgi:hypothetical protein
MPVSASPTGKHKAIAFDAFSPRLITRDLADNVWIISMPKIDVLIMYQEAIIYFQHRCEIQLEWSSRIR